MSAITAQDATSTFDCKTDGCAGIARHNRGPYAYLCDDCKTAAIGSRDRVVPLRPTPTLRDGFEAKAKSLVAVGKKLDRALANLKAKQATVLPAKQAFAEAMREWQQACRALGGDQQ